MEVDPVNGEFGHHTQVTFVTDLAVKMSRTCCQACTYWAAVFPLLPPFVPHWYQSPFISCANRRNTGLPNAFTPSAHSWMWVSWFPAMIAASVYVADVDEPVPSPGSQEIMLVWPWES